MKPLRALMSLSFALVFPLEAQVVINEVFYHPPDDLTDLQWLELYNTSDAPVNLSGWHLDKAVTFGFPPGSTIAPHGYTVICRDRKRFQEFYPVPVVGEFGQALKHSRQRLELRNAGGELVDSVEFGNQAPWPRGPDGWTASLERICPTVPGNLPENWIGSPLSAEATRPGGTPGDKNAGFCASLPPLIRLVSFPSNGVAPGQPIAVQAQVESKAALKEVSLLYRLVGPGFTSEEKSLPLSKADHPNEFSASIPGQQAGQIVRFRLQATDENSAVRIYPSPTEPRPAFSCLVFTNVVTGKIPVGYLIHTDPDEAQSALHQLQNGPHGAPASPQAQARNMVQMQFRAALDLPALWAALTLTNSAPLDLPKLGAVFREQERERLTLEQKLLSDPNPEQAARKIPELIRPFKSSLGDALKTGLSPDQVKVYEIWRDANAGPDGPRNNPEMMLRQFIPLEPDFLHLATSTNLTPAQLVSLRELYRDAVQQRDALVPDLKKLMSGQGQDRRAEGEKLEAKAVAIPAAVENKLKQTLTPSQARQFAAWKLAEQPSFMHHTRSKLPEPALGECAFILIEPQAQAPKLFDFVHIPERSGGWKVHFGKDRSWNDMTVIDLIFEASDRWLLSEPLAYDLHRRAGLAACRTDFLRLTVDGQPAGYYLLIEQPNKAFLRRNGLRDDGNLYKVNWVGNGLEEQHEKHTNRHTGNRDLVQLVDELEKTKDRPEAQWAVIRREFDVPEVLSHYAVRMLISDWDGFFNNYFLYHDLRGTRKWTFYPWDEDKTWGEYDGWERGGTLYNMPLSYASEGDHPPGEPGGRPSTEYGFREWWRAGGYISRPLLANPIFRKHFLARLKQLLDTEFTEARLFPLVDAFREQLLEEVEYRAQVMKEDPERARKHFESNLASLKEFITKRRQWLLEQEDLRTAGTFERPSLSNDPMRTIQLTVCLLLSLLAGTAVQSSDLLAARESPIGGSRLDRPQARSMVITQRGIVATSQVLASQAGAQILARGGSAADAAIAANAVLGVVEPMMDGMGGDLFALEWDARTGQLSGLNSSGWAPEKLTRELLKQKGFSRMPGKGIHSVTVPGCVRGWEALHQRFGRLPWRELFQPAIYYARNGFPVTEIVAAYWLDGQNSLTNHGEASRIFLPGGSVPNVGQIFRNPDCADALEKIASQGPEAFYRGSIATDILRTSEQLGGTLTAADLSDFKPEWVKPISTTYRGWTVYELPPNGQGMAALEMLNIFERFPLAQYGFASAEAFHVKLEAQKLAYADLRKYLADPRFAKVPVAGLLSKEYAAQRASTIDAEHAHCDVPPGEPPPIGNDTVYLTAVDKEGNIVSLIQSISALFGSGLVVDGFFLQNRGAGFTLDADHPNALAPRKRPFHTIIPAFMEKGDLHIGFGIMGGLNQPQAHAQFVSNLADYGMNLQGALEAPRFTKLNFGGCDFQIEDRVPAEVREKLLQKGHVLKVHPGYSSSMGGGQAVLHDSATGVNYGASSPRKDGAALPEGTP